MNCELELNQEQLLDIATHLKEKIINGVQSPNQELQCLPTFIPILQVPESGRALVVDFEQFYVEAAIVRLQDDRLHIEHGPVATTIPFTHGVTIERDELFDTLAELIVSLQPPQDLPLGYRFAYPMISTPEGDARLLRWTHEWFARETVGENMGQLLVEHLARHTPAVRCSNVAVINDTVASLLAGLTVTGADGYIAKWDDLLDARSQNPGEQRLEKALSCIYLAPLLAAVCPELGSAIAALSQK